MFRSVALLAFITFAAQIRADDGIPAKTLNEIKAATVFVKVETTRVTASGSGFLMQVDGETGLIVTNQHVVQLPVQAGPVRKIEVVFHSGKAKELIVQAELIAADADRDLAVLRVKKVADLPKPLDHKAKVELGETMTVYALGFPFGEALSTGKANPSITIGKGSISSLRENKDGELSLIQIDGDINPGNSGGPVVDGKGQLVGVAVAKVRGTNIGIAIPANDLTLMLRGRLGGNAYRVVGVEGNMIELEIMLKFIDPLDKIKSASILLAKAQPGAQIPKATKPGQHPELADAKAYDVKIADQQGLVKVKLPIDRHFLQILYTTEEKKDIRVAITAYDLATIAKNFRPAPTVGPSTTPTPGEATSIGDLTVRRVRIAAEQKPAPGVKLGFPIACLTWAADGKAFYAYDHSEKTVRKISFPDLKELAKLEVKKSCSWLSLSSEGLIATVLDDQEAWVLDPATLKKGITFPTNKAKRVLSAPKLDVAYVADCDDQGNGTLRVVDLKTGKKLKEYESRDLDRNCGFKTLVISPDGKHLFAVGGIEQLVQLSADREKVAFVAVSERLVQGAFQQPVVSPDGKFICAPSGGGNYKIKGSKEGNYATCVFNVGNLADPVVQLKTGAYPMAVGFDSKAKLFYAQNHEDHLIVLDSEGSKLKSYKIAKENISVIQILPHPDGRKMLILANGIGFGETNAYSVELDQAPKDPNAPKDPITPKDPPKDPIAPKAELPDVKPPKGWVEVSPKLTTFSAWFPEGKVKEDESSIVSKSGQIRFFTTALARKDGAVFIVAQMNLPPAFTKDTQKVRHDFLRDMALEEFDGKVVEDKKIEMAGLTGREILIQTKNDKLWVRMRIIGPGVQIYRVLVIGTKDQIESEDAGAFFDCFRRVSRIKPEPPKDK